MDKDLQKNLEDDGDKQHFKISDHQPKFLWKQTAHHGILPFRKYSKAH